MTRTGVKGSRTPGGGWTGGGGTRPNSRSLASMRMAIHLSRHPQRSWTVRPAYRPDRLAGASVIVSCSQLLETAG